MSPALSLPDLLAALGARRAPAFTWYAADERVELTGSLLAQWVAKSANLLTEEVEVGPGSTVYLDLPVHWRAFVFTLATWTTGGAVAFRQIDNVDVVISDRPDMWADTDTEVLALELAPLAREYPGELPAFVIDANAEVMGAADALGPMPRPTRDDIAVAGPNLRYHDLDELLAGGTSQRVMIQPANNNELARASAAQLLAGGSIVVIDPAFAHVDCTAVASQEHATPRAGTPCGDR
ncbi:MAG: TIGR03089 family protein [Bowdeniella nasicola]|nr:TIGR03089 family protein [Bowdeniella nasicola]